jgi:hypothetical protein
VTGEIALLGRLEEVEPHFDWHDAQFVREGLAWKRALHAFPFAVPLAESFRRSRLKRPRDQLFERIDAWRESCSIGRRGVSRDAWHLPTAAARFLNLAAAAAWLEWGPRDSDRGWYGRLLALHAVYLDRHRTIDGSDALIEAAASTVAAEILPGAPPGILRLEAEVARFILPDGAHASRTPRLQTVALAALIDARTMLGDGSPCWLDTALARAAGYLEQLLPDNGQMPVLGTSWIEGPSPDVLLEQARRLVTPVEPDPETCARDDASGLVALHSDDVHVVLRGGPSFGPGTPLPAHADALSFEAWFGEHQVVADSGEGCVEHAPDRVLARLARAHSTLLVDGIGPLAAPEPGLPGMLRRLRHGAPVFARTLQASNRDGASFAWSMHAAWDDPALAVTHHRLWGVSRRGVLLLDLILGEGRHTIESALPLDPGLTPRDVSLVALGCSADKPDSLPRYDRPGPVSQLRRNAASVETTLPAACGWLIWRGPLPRAFVTTPPTIRFDAGVVFVDAGGGEDSLRARWEVTKPDAASAVALRIGAP